PGGGASLAKPPLGRDDVIKKVAGVKIDDLNGFIEQYEVIMDSDPLPEYVLINFERTGRKYLTLLKPKPEKDRDPPPELSKAWVGVALQPVLGDLAEHLGDKQTTGFWITRVYPNTLAAESDLIVGDIITHLNGKRIKPTRSEDVGRFQRAVKKLDVEDKAEIRVVRTREPLTISLQLESTRVRPDEARRDHNRDFDMRVREVTFFDRVDKRWDDEVKGVIVLSLESAGWADLGGIRFGDLIQRIDDYPVTDLDSYRQAMERITEAEPERVVFYLLRGVRTRFQYIEPEWNPRVDEKESK
ncbi:MAG: PDZ domain-containing protein, partial [Phycisphaerae bacterium]